MTTTLVPDWQEMALVGAEQGALFRSEMTHILRELREIQGRAFRSAGNVMHFVGGPDKVEGADANLAAAMRDAAIANNQSLLLIQRIERQLSGQV